MKFPLPLILLLACPSCVAPHQNSPARQNLSAEVDQLCTWTGLRRASPIKSVERWRGDNPGYSVGVNLSVGSRVQRYIIRFDAQHHVLSFQPKNADLSGLEQGLGFDNVHNSRRRAGCVAAVAKLNRYLRWTYYGPPAIQKAGSNFLVTYVTLSQAELERLGSAIVHPYISFLVTPRGTVIATFLGA